MIKSEPDPTTDIKQFTTQTEAKARFLEETIKDAIKHVQRNRKINQRRAALIRIATILFSALATILLGLQILGMESYFKQIAFVLGAFVTLLNAIEPFFNYRALWVEHEQALASFYGIRDSLAFYLSGTRPEDLEMDALNQFHNEYQMVWQQLSRSWIEYRRSEQLMPSNKL